MSRGGQAVTVDVLWIDRKGFMLKETIGIEDVRYRITRHFPVRQTVTEASVCEPTSRSGKIYIPEVPMVALAFALVERRGGVYVYREILD